MNLAKAIVDVLPTMLLYSCTYTHKGKVRIEY